MDNKLKFSVSNIEVFEETKSSKFALLKIECFADGENAHDVVVTESVLKNAGETIYNMPIVWFYDKVFDDAGGHDPDEMPCGLVPESASISYEELDDGRLMFTINGAIIWKQYTGKILEIFEKGDGKKDVSVEISISDWEETEDGNIELLEYSYDAITILGDRYNPAIPGANAKVISFAKEKDNFKKDFKKEFLFSSENYGEIDFSIPEEVKESVSTGLSLMEENETNIQPAIINYSKYLKEESEISPRKSRYIYSHLERYMKKIGDSEDINSDYISFMMLGGNNGADFLFDIVEEMEFIDNETMNYFNFNGKEESAKMKKKKEKAVVEENLDEIEEEFSEDVTAEEEIQTDGEFQEDKGEDDEIPHMAEGEEEEDDSDKESDEESDESSDEFSLTARQKSEILMSAFSDSSYWVETFDDEYVYIYSWEDQKTYRLGYSIENNVATIDAESRTEVINGGYEVVGDESEDDTLFSLDSFFDAEFALELIGKDDDEEYSKFVSEKIVSSDIGEFTELTYGKISEMTSELKELSQFKSDVEQQNIDVQIEQTIAEVQEYMTPEEIDELREDAKELDSDNIVSWQNSVKAKVYDRSKDITSDEKDKITKIAIPTKTTPKRKNGGRWAGKSKR